MLEESDPEPLELAEAKDPETDAPLILPVFMLDEEPLITGWLGEARKGDTPADIGPGTWLSGVEGWIDQAGAMIERESLHGFTAIDSAALIGSGPDIFDPDNLSDLAAPAYAPRSEWAIFEW